MKGTKFFKNLLAVILAITFAIGLCACNSSEGDTKDDYSVYVNMTKSLEIEVGDTVDYKQYFIVTDPNGNEIMVTDAMLDTSKVDTSKEGQFTVTLTIGSVSRDLTFTVVSKKGGSDDTGNTDNTGNNDEEISAVLAKYTNVLSWNFAVTYNEIKEGSVGYEDYYEYYEDSIRYEYSRFDDYDNYLGEATDYVGYDEEQNAYYLYYDNLDNTYTKYKANTTSYYNHYNLYDLYLDELANYTFTKSGDGYSADKPNDVGNAVIGEFTDYTWTKFTIQISNGNISQIDGTQSDGFIMRFIFSKYGQISFTLPNASSSGGTTTPVEPTGTMEKQIYNSATFDDERLQSKLTKTGKYADPAIGLPATGSYTALVVPVQLKGTTITQTQLTNLNIAFNGTSEQTGWESVKTYYQKASYGKLNLSFDIADIYETKYAASYYESHTATEDGQTYNDGDNVILQEVLKYYESRLDLTKYDANNDGAIDAVYLIYSAPVDYSDDSFYWAYVTWDDDDAKTTYDGKDAYYYLFAGLDFMIESVQGGYVTENYPVISGLKVNATTYIHETGHLLGLDDYYDYNPDEGCNEGLGAADMMDFNVGDHNVYSKTMLGWLTPQIVTSTTTVTIKSSQAEGDAILVPLKFDNSYFCEYLLIDLYSAQGLNKLHASVSDSYLYDGAAYGVRIYHVSSWIENAYDNDFGSFTDNNNSLSNVALIKLVEADGESKFASSNGYAMGSDLWKAGDKLSDAFPKYTTNDGKLLIFDISIVSVSQTQATITITYNA